MDHTQPTPLHPLGPEPPSSFNPVAVQYIYSMASYPRPSPFYSSLGFVPPEDIELGYLEDSPQFNHQVNGVNIAPLQPSIPTRMLKLERSALTPYEMAKREPWMYTTKRVEEALQSVGAERGGRVPGVRLAPSSKGRHTSVAAPVYAIRVVDEGEGQQQILDCLEYASADHLVIVDASTGITTNKWWKALARACKKTGACGILDPTKPHPQLLLSTRQHHLAKSRITRLTAWFLDRTFAHSSPPPMRYTRAYRVGQVAIPNHSDPTAPPFIIHCFDLIMMDDDGCVVIPNAYVDRVLTAARELHMERIAREMQSLIA